jgi:HEAT repeat protein
MAKDQHLITSSRVPRNIAIGVGIALLLTLIEGAVWLLAFSGGGTHNISTFLSSAAHTPLFLLVLLLQLIAACILVQVTDRPLALLRYIREVQRAQEQYRALNTPINSWPAVYETTITYVQDSPDPSVPGQVQSMSLFELAQHLAPTSAAGQAHQLILGAPGAGKTMLLRSYQYMALQQGRALIAGRDKIPIYVPLRNYSLYLEAGNAASIEEGDAGDHEGLVKIPRIFLALPTPPPSPLRTDRMPLVGTQSLLDFLYASDLPGLHHLRPFLKSLRAQGRVLFLCDGLDEVDEANRAAVTMELAELMGQNQNQLVLTCREVEYRELPQLAQTVAENLVARVQIVPLDGHQVRSFVERFIEEQDPDKKWRHTAGQVMEVIDRSRLRDYCTNPLLVFCLMEIIDEIGIDRGKQLDTRGQLLRAYVMHLIQRERAQARWGNAAPAEDDVLLMLSELACAARWTNDASAIQLSLAGGSREVRVEDLADGLLTWLNEHPAQSLWALDAVESIDAQGAIRRELHEPYSREELGRLVQIAQGAGLIEISPGGILNFRHELIAAYFVAEYCMAVRVGHSAGDAEGVINQASVETRFITPVALWAGLLDDPAECAQRFAALGRQKPAFNLEALALSLVCMGVANTPPQAENAHQPVLPTNLKEALAKVVRDGQACNALARLFTRYAEEGAQEIYQSLYSLLLVDGVDEFVTRLNAEIVPELLFARLCDVVDDAAYETMVKRLVRVLGRFGAVAVPLASELSVAMQGRSERLRSAAINILGGTDEQGAVEPLIICLHDANQFIVGRAANALIRLGPEHCFTPLIQELEDPAGQEVHWTVLHILERFLNEPNAARQLTPSQHARLVNVLLHVLTSHYAPEEQKKAREMLVQQGRTAEVNVAGEKAVELLVQYLSSTDDTIVRSALRTLKEIGSAATPCLLDQLKPQTPEMMRMRIVEVLGYVRDQRALPYLLLSLDDPALVVQQQVASALQTFAPESIPGLIDRVLHSASELVATRAEQVLGGIGEAAVTPVIQALSPVVPGRTHLLVRVLERIRDPRAIPALIALLRDSTPAHLEMGLGLSEGHAPPQTAATLRGPLDSPRATPPTRRDGTASVRQDQRKYTEQTLQVAVVHALGQFPDERVVSPLLDMLASSNVLLYEGAINALSYLEDVALDELIAALDVEPPEDVVSEEQRREIEQKSILATRVQRALLGMPHFPGERLLEVAGVGSDAQVKQVIEVFLAKGTEAAQVVVANLFHPDERIQRCVRSIAGEMSGQVIVPALLEALDHPEPGWRAMIAKFLLRYPREAIPPLVSLLDDFERGNSAEKILLAFGPEILPYLVPGLDALNNMAQERSQRIVVTLVQQTPELIYDVVQLFSLSPPQRAREALLNLLTNELVDLSVPALLGGLEDAHLVGDVSEALVCLVNFEMGLGLSEGHAPPQTAATLRGPLPTPDGTASVRQDQRKYKDNARSEMVLNELLEALRVEERRHGAGITLIEVGAKAVPGVGNLITDRDPAVAQAAQNILTEMGVPAFAFIWAAHSDTSNRARREAARSIFRKMPTIVIKDELVQLLRSNEPDDITMAMTLLLERIHGEALLAHHDREMIPSLLEYVQAHGDEQASLRIIGLLILLDRNAIIDHVTQVLYDYPNHHERIFHALLLLGEEAEEVLLEMLHDPDAPAILRAEAASLLGMVAPNVDIREYARMLGEYGLWAGQSVGRGSVLHPDRLAISLRALGGLLVGGHWDMIELQNLRLNSKERSAERELYDVLLGWRYGPHMTMLENELQTEQEEHKRNILKLSQQILDMQTHMSGLEHQLEQLNVEHGVRGEELDLANEKIKELEQALGSATQETRAMRDNLQRSLQERQTLKNRIEEIAEERDTVRTQHDEWRRYAEQLEAGLQRPQSPRKK